MSERPFRTNTDVRHDKPGPTIRLVTFGDPALIAGTATLALSPLRAALLGLLATAPEDGVRQARVMELLWRPAPSSRLRHRLSQLIYSLNRALSERLVVKKRHRIYLSEVLATDYRDLVSAMSTHRLMEATDILRRGFLSELANPPSDAFSEWLEQTRLELRGRIRQAVAEQWTHLTREGRWKQAAEPARALLSLNPYDEQALRMLIRAEAGAGRVREAEAVFHSFVERSEWGSHDWVPQAETLSLVNRIRDLPAQTGIRAGPPVVDRPPLIGRSEELAALSAAMRPRPGGGLRLVVIRGERGTGKTRLVEETLTTDRLTGIRVFRCRAAAAKRHLFLSPVIDALASSDIDSDLGDLADPWRATVTELLTESHARANPPFEPLAVELDEVHRRYFEAIRQLLIGVARNEPVILFIDDYHRVEEDSAAALRYLVQRWPSLPLTVTLAITTGSVREEDPVKRLIGESRFRCTPTEISLGELTREAAAELVNITAGARIDEGVRDRIVELSDRNPLFLLALAKRSLEGRRLPKLDPDDFVPVPRSISHAFSDRLAELDDDTERILQLLGVMGRPLGVDTLAKLTERSRDWCAGTLERLERCRLIRRNPRGFAVRHELLRHIVYERMGRTRRSWVHGRVATHLDDANTTVTATELATHYLHAGMLSKAVGHAIVGASVAEKAGALKEASKLFALMRRNINDPGVQARLAERLARLHYARRDTADGPTRLAEAASELRKVRFVQNALVAKLQRVELLASSGTCSPADAVARIRELGRTATQGRHWKAVARAVELEFHIHRREGQAREAHMLAAHTRKLLGQVEPASRGPLRASLALHHHGGLGAGLEHAREAISLARQGQAPIELLQALVRLVAIQGARGLIADPETASAVEEGEALARGCGEFIEHYNLLAGAGVGYRAVGRIDQAGGWFARAGRVLANVKTCESHVALECKLGELALEERELTRAAAHFGRARALWTPAMGRHLEIIGHSGAGLTALLAGKMALAREMAAHVSDPPADWFEDPWVFALFTARLCGLRGVIGDGADALGEIAGRIETSQPANWVRLKFEEARLRLRHSLPDRDEVAETAADAAADLGIDRWVEILDATRRRARQR